MVGHSPKILASQKKATTVHHHGIVDFVDDFALFHVLLIEVVFPISILRLAMM